MKEKVGFLGLDVHAETIAVAIGEAGGLVRSLGTIANRAESIRKMVKKLVPVEHLKPATRLVQRGTFCSGSWRNWASSAR